MGWRYSLGGLFIPLRVLGARICPLWRAVYKSHMQVFISAPVTSNMVDKLITAAPVR